MSEEPKNLTDPDFSRGVDFADLAAAEKLAGRVGEEIILLVLSGEKVFAVGAHCTHYHAPLIDCLAEDYKEKRRVMAVASIFRDIDSLHAEIAMERARR
ncbi:hypothetical protein [Methylocystis echinoides]|uniref:Pterin-binding domain-containing protein n=1 Tax=Methylocystis echinoides TaxID=29468 RepID=A0A9W6GZB9_9HYPH|nr:hypothetical protein [Methylocystis echinoides]GLI95674.1 hypothetical protein LMG27198_46660 [Methylocystis echinoides]